MEIRLSSCSRRHRVTSPLQPNIIKHAAEKSGYAIEAAEERKYAQHEKNCSEQGFLFVPLAVESLGGLSVTLKKALKRIALLADSRNYQSQGHAIAFDRLAQSVSVLIVRGSATMLLARVPEPQLSQYFWTNSIVGKHCDFQEEWSLLRSVAQ